MNDARGDGRGGQVLVPVGVRAPGADKLFAGEGGERIAGGSSTSEIHRAREILKSLGLIFPASREIGQRECVSKLRVVGNERDRFAQVWTGGGEILLLEVAISDYAVQSGNDVVLHGGEVFVRETFGTIEMIESADRILCAIGGGLRSTNGQRVAENDGRSERILRRGRH
jgi:hypothetical protein